VNYTLLRFSSEHQDFLFRLYADTRREEISSFGWPSAQQEVFLRMQFNAQQSWYGMAYPEAEHQLILVDGQPAGRILIFREAGANRLVDIALLSGFRGQGMGTQLLRDLIDNSARAGVPVRLQVLKSNPARRLYQRLGFIETGEDEMYYQMEKKASGH
jgi:ribosomal protein S18 acetylase RimI-like enzyme